MSFACVSMSPWKGLRAVGGDSYLAGNASMCICMYVCMLICVTEFE